VGRKESKVGRKTIEIKQIIKGKNNNCQRYCFENDLTP